jgi:hypothetical protein
MNRSAERFVVARSAGHPLSHDPSNVRHRRSITRFAITRSAARFAITHGPSHVRQHDGVVPLS